MAAGDWHDTIFGGNINWGIMGLVDTIPKGFVLKTGIFYGSNGINKVSKILYSMIIYHLTINFLINLFNYNNSNSSWKFFLNQALTETLSNLSLGTDS